MDLTQIADYCCWGAVVSPAFDVVSNNKTDADNLQ